LKTLTCIYIVTIVVLCVHVCYLVCDTGLQLVQRKF